MHSPAGEPAGFDERSERLQSQHATPAEQEQDTAEEGELYQETAVAIHAAHRVADCDLRPGSTEEAAKSCRKVRHIPSLKAV